MDPSTTNQPTTADGVSKKKQGGSLFVVVTSYVFVSICIAASFFFNQVMRRHRTDQLLICSWLIFLPATSPSPVHLLQWLLENPAFDLELLSKKLLQVPYVPHALVEKLLRNIPLTSIFLMFLLVWYTKVIALGTQAFSSPRGN
jgi:hypothetical protein